MKIHFKDEDAIVKLLKKIASHPHGMDIVVLGDVGWTSLNKIAELKFAINKLPHSPKTRHEKIRFLLEWVDQLHAMLIKESF